MRELNGFFVSSQLLAHGEGCLCVAVEILDTV